MKDGDANIIRNLRADHGDDLDHLSDERLLEEHSTWQQSDKECTLVEWCQMTEEWLKAHQGEPEVMRQGRLGDLIKQAIGSMVLDTHVQVIRHHVLPKPKDVAALLNEANIALGDDGVTDTERHALRLRMNEMAEKLSK